jgi:hypothetical protein
MGSIYRRRRRDGSYGSVFWVKYYADGRPVRESTGTKNQKQAERFLKGREGRIALGETTSMLYTRGRSAAATRCLGPVKVRGRELRKTVSPYGLRPPHCDLPRASVKFG